MQTITFPDLNCAVHGAAFTAPECPTDSVLPGFRVPQDGLIHIGLLHGDVTTSDSRYRRISRAAGWTIWRWVMFTAAAAF